MILVAPRAGAWIETCLERSGIVNTLTSPLAQGRGLKLSFSVFLAPRKLSPLAQGRGLKQSNGSIQFYIIKVAPRAGAWIETFRVYVLAATQKVAPRAGAWIETLLILLD